MITQGSLGKDGIRFLTFDRLKGYFADPETGRMGVAGSLASGMMAGLVASSTAVTPTERIKTALIDDSRSPGARRFKGPIDAIRILVAEKGVIRALYAGYATTTLKQMGATSVRLGTYNIIKDYERSKGIAQTTGVSFANGAVVGVITTYSTQPFDVLKTRAQSAQGATTSEAFRSVIADYGVRGLWKGTVMRLSRTVLAGGILFTSYEAMVKLLNPLISVL